MSSAVDKQDFWATTRSSQTNERYVQLVLHTERKWGKTRTRGALKISNGRKAGRAAEKCKVVPLNSRTTLMRRVKVDECRHGIVLITSKCNVLLVGASDRDVFDWLLALMNILRLYKRLQYRDMKAVSNDDRSMTNFWNQPPKPRLKSMAGGARLEVCVERTFRGQCATDTLGQPTMCICVPSRSDRSMAYSKTEQLKNKPIAAEFGGSVAK
ncbi:unnamed protein product [Soboliphyme baturini]|uniref:PH domain-containing protein n=1 Tax=Soboliphyme baturini TaxID=241478 RepID=A0A183J465_9BILA|nr:unnamed protein product [Soboliphyme baturini]